MNTTRWKYDVESGIQEAEDIINTLESELADATLEIDKLQRQLDDMEEQYKDEIANLKDEIRHLENSNLRDT